MKIYLSILTIFSMSILYSQDYIYGYFRVVEASFCMDECSNYMLEDENGEMISFLVDFNEIDVVPYVDRYVEIQTDEIYQCFMCSAQVINSVNLSNDCELPVFCFADPCEVAEPCEINTPVECVSSYCGGCWADFYDLDGNLVDCYAETVEPCDDLEGIFCGVCDMYMGVAVVNGQCEGVSGCGWIVDGIDYSDALFDSTAECENSCINEPYLCEDIQYDYDQLHSGLYGQCEVGTDCISVWGHCDVGLGGCHYSVNSENYLEEEIDNLVDLWNDNDCMEWVCDCASLPPSICNNGTCELAYCYGPNPSGCFATGCLENYGCVDYEETGDCVPSWCSCDEFYGDWFCTEDCNGGSCYQLGDVNYDDNLDIVDIVSIVNMIIGLSEPNILSDLNSDQLTNIIDVVLLIDFILE